MLLALLLLAQAASLHPARWHSSNPRSLSLLDGSAVNCLLFESTAWAPPMIAAAHEKHLTVIALLHPGPATVGNARRAAALGFDGAALEGEYPASLASEVRTALTPGGLDLIELPVRSAMPLGRNDPIAGTWQGLWPGIEIEHGGKVSTGPTSTPWIDTNAGLLRFLRAAATSTIWLSERPRPGTSYPPERYGIAIADAAIAGAHWVISLDSDLERRLLGRDPRAIAAWRKIGNYLRYFVAHQEWAAYRPFGEFTLVQDVASGGLLSSGLLDLLAVQHTAARAVATPRLDLQSLHGARIVLNVDPDSLKAQQQRDLAEFAAAGGKVVSGPPGWRFPQTAPGQTAPTKQQMDKIQPIWETIYGNTARKNFGARTFNTASIIFNLLAAPDGKSMLVHLLNYADYPSEDITVQVLGTWHRARLYRPDAPVVELPVYPVKDGTGVDIAKVDVVASLVID